MSTDRTPTVPDPNVQRTEGQALTGTVKYYKIDKGYGFIAVDDGGADVFVHQTAIQTEGFRCLVKGSNVSFVFKLRQGKEIAQNVTVTATPGGLATSFASRLEAMVASAKVDRDPNLLDGTVKWFDYKKGFGFIIPKVGGNVDVFVHVGQIEGQVALTEGDEVEYKVTTDEEKGRQTATYVRLTARDGQPVLPNQGVLGRPPPMLRAPAPPAPPQTIYVDQYGRQIQYAPPAAPAPAPVSLGQGQHHGTVKWYNEEKGYGFIITATGQDMYVNKSQLSGCNGRLTEGESVVYEEQANNGKVWAVNVQRARAGAPAPPQAPQYAPAPAAPQYAQQVVYAQPQPIHAQAQPQQVMYAPVGSKRKAIPAPLEYGKAVRPKYEYAQAPPQAANVYAPVEREPVQPLHHEYDPYVQQTAVPVAETSYYASAAPRGSVPPPPSRRGVPPPPARSGLAPRGPRGPEPGYPSY